MNRLKINNSRFSVSLCSIAKTYGFKTVGSFSKFLNNLESPSTKLYYNTTYVRAFKLINELNDFKKSH